MQKKWQRLIGALLCAAMLAGCAPSQPPTEPTTLTEQTDPTQSSMEETVPTVPVTTEPTVTDPTVTDPTVTEPTVTDPTVTDPTVTEPPVTDPTVTDPTVPTPTVTKPTVPTAPTEPKPTVPAPTQPKPTQPKPTQPRPTEPEPTEPLPTEPEEELIDIDADQLPCAPEELYQQLFDPDTWVGIDIRMDETELQKMQDDYDYYTSFDSKSPIYRIADVVITIGQTNYLIREVGVRMKGNTSRTSFYDPAKGGIYNAVHLKLDFQQTFDDEDYYGDEAKVWSDKTQRKARKNRTFATMEELELRWNKTYDPSYLREVYAHELYASEGILVPLVNLCSLDWGGVHMGLYTVHEPVDQIFLQKRLPSQDLGGDLYKCGRRSDFTSTTSIGIEDEDQGLFYAYDLKTNKKTSDHSSLKHLIQRLNASDLTRQEFAELVDVDSFLTYAAVSWFLGNPDDMRNYYNNFYIYFLKSSGKLIVIPYDLDQCFGLTCGSTMAQYDPFSDLAEYHRDKTAQTDPLFMNTVVRGSFYADDFADALERVSRNRLLEAESFRKWFDRARSIHRRDVEPSKELQNMAGRTLDFDMTRTTASSITFGTFLDTIMQTYRTYMDEYRASQI